MKRILTLCLLASAAALLHAQTLNDDVDFLYQYMPQCDVADYPRSFFEENARMTRRALREMPWGTQLDETLVRHFVLPLRVNNEPLDSFRLQRYEELAGCVLGLSMTQAAIAVNRWCHRHVTYQPTDGRTSSPLQSLRTAYGRCGEESTLCVAAMRTVGIPARQVYTPRWAHCDDNHAWVEVWTDGAWHFLGACEPEPVLDLGWFNAPASRGMMMHTKVFGDYHGKEEVVLRTPTYTEINVTPIYAPTRTVEIYVEHDGKPVEGARVEFKVYNYAEFFTAVARQTDAAGLTRLTSGLGDLLVWASKDGRFGYKKVNFAHAVRDTLRLSLTASDALEDAIDISVPQTNFKQPPVSAELRAENDRCLATGDSIRHAYEATMPQLPAAGASLRDTLLFRSRGNCAVVGGFLQRYGEEGLPLLSSLSEKDLRDVTPDVLLDHQLHSPRRAGVSEYEYRRHVLCPRVALEPLTPYKAFFQTEGFTFESVGAVREWCNSYLSIDDKANSNGTYVTPIGVYRSRSCDSRSRDVFMVAVCRASGLPAWVDEVTGDFRAADTHTDAPHPSEQTGTLLLTGDRALPYYTRFTLSRLDGGTPRLLTYPEDATLQTLSGGLSLAAGHYLLTTGTRLRNGNVKATLEQFEIEADKTTTLAVTPRTANETSDILGHLDDAQGPCVIALIASGDEPSNHVVRDIAGKRDDFEREHLPVRFYFTSQAQKRKFRLDGFPPLPADTKWLSDDEGRLATQLANALPLHNASNLPIVVYVDAEGNVLMCQQGYTIGIGEAIIKTHREAGQ